MNGRGQLCKYDVLGEEWAAHQSVTLEFPEWHLPRIVTETLFRY